MSNDASNLWRREQSDPEISSISAMRNRATGEFDYRTTMVFDVPNQRYTDGCTTGFRVASEVLRSQECGREDTILTLICGACSAFEANRGHAIDPSRVGAAVGFLSAISAVVHGATLGLSADVSMAKFEHDQAQASAYLQQHTSTAAAVAA